MGLVGGLAAIFQCSGVAQRAVLGPQKEFPPGPDPGTPHAVQQGNGGTLCFSSPPTARGIPHLPQLSLPSRNLSSQLLKAPGDNASPIGKSRHSLNQRQGLTVSE